MNINAFPIWVLKPTVVLPSVSSDELGLGGNARIDGFLVFKCYETSEDTEVILFEDDG